MRHRLPYIFKSKLFASPLGGPLLGCVLAVIFAPFPLTAAPPAGAIVITGARLIDGTGRPPIEKGVLVLRDGRIAAAGAEGSVALPADGHNIDLSGRTIMPGLISAHSHLGLVQGVSAANPANYTRENVARQLLQYERYGVTAVMSLGVNRDILYTWRDQQRAGNLPGADIFTADRGLGVPGGAPPFPVPVDQMYRPKTPDEARADVREMAARHPDILKLWLDDIFGTMPKMEPAIYQAARLPKPTRRSMRRTGRACAWRGTSFTSTTPRRCSRPVSM
jgi:hypothetical protein